MLRLICLAAGAVVMVMTFTKIKEPFWRTESFNTTVNRVQMEGNYLPYRIRKIVWSKPMAIVKTEISRVADYLWLDKWTGKWEIILLWPLFAGMSLRFLPEISVYLLVYFIGAISNHPDYGYFARMAMVILIPIIAAGIRKIKIKYFSK